MLTLNILKAVGLPLLAFVLGSIPLGVVFARLFGSVDIRNHGSNNIGATNVNTSRTVLWPVA